MRNTLENQIERLIAMKEEFSRAIDEAIANLNEIDERSKSQEWLDYAEEYGFDVDDLMDVAMDRLETAEQDYNVAYSNMYVGDFTYRSFDDILM